MNKAILSVRELQEEDISLLADYWCNADPDFLIGMGVDLSKMPTRTEWLERLSTLRLLPMAERDSYPVIWRVNDQSVGHSNVNKIIFNEEAHMHLHLWDAASRQQGWGVQLVSMTLPYFFRNLGLKRIICEPYALNPAPNKTLERVGFSFVRRYTTVPGSLNFEQEVNRWEMTVDAFRNMHRSRTGQ